MDNRIRKIVLTGGGSGGHIYPLLAVAEKLRELATNQKVSFELFYIGPKDSYSAMLKSENITTKNISSGKIRRYFSISNIFDVPRFFIGLVQAFFVMYVLMPDAVFSKGGTGALPVIIAAWFYRIPVIIHESDAVPGLTNLLSARFASRIAVSFEKAARYFDPRKTALIGTPIRQDLLRDPIDKKLAKKELGFSDEEPLLLVWGGSRGSTRINEFIVSNLPVLIKEGQILHQTGRGNYADIQKLSRAALMDVAIKTEIQSRYQAVPYLEENLKMALSAADLVIARAGSGTIFELAAFGKPAILIPLTEAAQGHQRENAYEFAGGGGGVVIEESNLLAGVFFSQLRTILKNPDVLAKMSAASAQFFSTHGGSLPADRQAPSPEKGNAAAVIAQEILNIS